MLITPMNRKKQIYKESIHELSMIRFEDLKNDAQW